MCHVYESPYKDRDPRMCVSMCKHMFPIWSYLRHLWNSPFVNLMPFWMNWILQRFLLFFPFSHPLFHPSFHPSLISAADQGDYRWTRLLVVWSSLAELHHVHSSLLTYAGVRGARPGNMLGGAASRIPVKEKKMICCSAQQVALKATLLRNEVHGWMDEWSWSFLTWGEHVRRFPRPGPEQLVADQRWKPATFNEQEAPSLSFDRCG